MNYKSLALLLAFPLFGAEEKDKCCPPPPPPPPAPVLLTVAGRAELETPPDEAVLRFFVGKSDTDLNAAKRVHNELATRVLAILKENGVADDDIRADLAISRKLKVEGSVRKREVLSHKVRTDYLVTVRKMDRLNKIVDGLIEAGVEGFNGVQFQLAHPEERMKTLRMEALSDAREQAEETAKRTGVKLGRLMRIDFGRDMSSSFEFAPGISGATGLENQYIVGGANVTRRAGAEIPGGGQADSVSEGSEFEADDPVITRPGKITVEVTVNLTYEIADHGQFIGRAPMPAPAPAPDAQSPKPPPKPAR